MELHPLADPGPSREALALYRYLRRYGGSVRLSCILKRAENERALLAAAIDELCERYWIVIVWRKPRAVPPPGEPSPMDDADRLCITRFGRRTYLRWSSR
jgi:hypothetical protein